MERNASLLKSVTGVLDRDGISAVEVVPLILARVPAVSPIRGLLPRIRIRSRAPRARFPPDRSSDRRPRKWRGELGQKVKKPFHLCTLTESWSQVHKHCLRDALKGEWRS